MKLDILCPQYRSGPVQAQWALQTAAAYAEREGWDVRMPNCFGSAMVDRARNIALSRVRPDADYVLFADDDMAPDADAIVRLLKHEVPAVSGLCCSRELPIKILASEWDAESDRFCPLEAANDGFRGKLMTGNYVAATAFLLIQRTAIDALVEYYLSGRDWLDNNHRMFDRLHVRSEWREAERRRIEERRREAYAKNKIPGVFAFSYQQDQTNGLGEDYYFCRSLLRLGYKVSVDTGCIVGHLGDFPFSPLLLGITDAKDVRFSE